MILIFLFLVNSVFAQDIATVSSQPATQSAESSPSATIQPTQNPLPTPDLLQQKIDQYTKDYHYARDLYSQAYLEYTNKKQVHTQYGTIVTETEKLKATRLAMIARNNMMRTYLLTLRVKLDKYLSQAPTETEKQKIEINKWEAWFEEQNTIVNSLLSPADFTKNAEEFKSKYNQIRKVISTALVQNQVNLSRLIAKQIEPITAEIATNSLKPEGQQLLSEVRVKLDLSEKSLKSAIQITQDNQGSYSTNDLYSDSKSNLIRSKDYLMEIVSNIEGILIRFTNITQ